MMIYMDLIDGKYLFNALRDSEVVLDFNKLREGYIVRYRRYYTCIGKGRRPPPITEYLRYNGYHVKVRLSDYEDEHIVDMVTDMVHYSHIYKGEIAFRLISDKTALLPSIALAQELGARFILVGPNNSPLRRNAYNFISLQDFMDDNELNQARDFTQDKLENRNWVDFHQDRPSDLIREL